MSDFPTTRLSLLRRVRDHDDHQAWTEFVTLYRPVVYRFARRRGLQEADAQDLAQSVLTAVAQQVGQWQPDSSRAKFRTWLARIAQNQVITMYRRRRDDVARGGTSVIAQLSQQPEQTDDADLLQAQYRRETFRHAARLVRPEFEETTWQAFWMTAVEERSAADTAQSLGRSIGSIYTARSRIIRRLQQVVELLQDRDDAARPMSTGERS